MAMNIDISDEEIAAFCQRNHIRRLSLFGSALRDDFTPESDIDVLVEFEWSTRRGNATTTHPASRIPNLPIKTDP